MRIGNITNLYWFLALVSLIRYIHVFMRGKLIALLLLAMGMLCSVKTTGQVTSNKGTDFWIGYMGHIDGTGSNMKLYVTSDVNTTGTVSIPKQNWSLNFSVTASSVTVLNIPPDTAYVGCGDCVEPRAIQLTSVHPVVAYSHIHANARSDATLVLPTATLGREYYCMSNEQMVTGSNRQSQFMVVATEDTTTVEITPTATSINGFRMANSMFIITLNKGDAYQFHSNTDITGSHIRSVAGNTGKCKRIAVFSGSSFTSLGCSGSGDNLYQQMYPVSAWGKGFVTVPFKTRTGGDIFRVLASENGTIVYVNGVFAKVLDAGEYHEFLSTTPNYVTATKPIKMAQFQRTQACGGLGDPSMTILSPIEQQLNDITLYSSPFQNIQNQHINVVMKRTDTGSFRLDNAKVQWSFVTANPNYMYTQTTVTAGNHTLTADSGFSAVAYGFGNVESYGYAAGANIRNLTHYISTSSETGAAAVCKGVATKFVPNTNYTPDKYRWYLADTFYSDSVEPVITFDTLGTFNMALVTINTNQNDCASQDSSTISITVRQQPEARFTLEQACLSDTIKFVDSSVIEGTSSTISKWNWEFGDGTNNPNKNVFKHYDSSYTYDVKLTITTNHGCIDTITHKVPVYPMPKPGFTFNNVCYNDTAYFTDTATIDSTVIVDYVWSFGDGGTDTLQNPKYVHTYADTFSVKQKAISDKGCADSVYQDIVIYPRPVAKIQTADVCYKDTATLNDVTITTTDYVVQRQWWEETQYIDSNLMQLWVPVDTGLHNITLWVENNFGCNDTQKVVIDVFSKPQAAFSVLDICYIDTAKFNDLSTIDEGSITQWLWAFGDGGGSFLQNPQKKYNTPAQYNPKLTVTSDRGCTDTISKQVDVIDMPDVKFGISDVCVYDTASFNDYSTIKYGTQSARFWQLGDGTTDTATTPKHKYAGFGSYNVKLRVEVSGLCVDSGEKVITIYPRPLAHFTYDDKCVKEIAEFKDSSTINSGSIVSRQWDLSGKPDTAKTVYNTFFIPGQKDIELVVASQFGCKDTVVRQINIHPEPWVDFTATEVCLRDTTRFIDSVTILWGAIASYQWNFDDSYTGSGRTPEHVYNNWGDYSVELTATSDKGCINSNRESVRVNPLPRAEIFTPDLDECQPFEVPFKDVSQVAQGNITRWLWDFGDNHNDTVQDPTHTYTLFGVYTPYLRVITDKGCKHDTTYNNYITVYQLPIADFTANPQSVSFFNPEIQLSNTSSSDVVAWDWSFGNGQFSNTSNPKITYSDTGRYWVDLIVRNQNWCKDSARQQVFIWPDYTFFIPNAFTPDAGELNPVFGPEGIFKGLIEYKMEIFTRWGEKVFETTDLAKKWNGEYKSVPAAQGVYIYKISTMDYFKNRKHYSGTVLLIR